MQALQSIRSLPPDASLLAAEPFQAIRVRALAYGSVALCGDWGFCKQRTPGQGVFYWIQEGEARLTVERDGEMEAHTLAPGDLAFLPSTATHAVRREPTSPTVDLAEFRPFFAQQEMRGFRFQAGQGDCHTRLLNGKYTFAHAYARPWDRFFPTVLVLPAPEVTADTRLAAVLELFRAEVETGGPGAQLVVERLLDILVIYAVRLVWQRGEMAPEGPLAALLDAQMGPVLARLHHEPNRAWQLAELAQLAHMGRTRFAQRFRAMLGESPMRYLARCRMQWAIERLNEEGQTVSAVAAEVGYADEFAFRKAFRRITGVPPGEFLRATAN